MKKNVVLKSHATNSDEILFSTFFVHPSIPFFFREDFLNPPLSSLFVYLITRMSHFLLFPLPSSKRTGFMDVTGPQQID